MTVLTTILPRIENESRTARKHGAKREKAFPWQQSDHGRLFGHRLSPSLQELLAMAHGNLSFSPSPSPSTSHPWCVERRGGGEVRFLTGEVLFLLSFF